MQRISVLLQKIEDLLQNPRPKSTIEIDLLLDYTRVMYADLLEWRSQVTPAPIVRPMMPPINEPTLAEMTMAMEQTHEEVDLSVANMATAPAVELNAMPAHYETPEPAAVAPSAMPAAPVPAVIPAAVPAPVAPAPAALPKPPARPVPSPAPAEASVPIVPLPAPELVKAAAAIAEPALQPSATPEPFVPAPSAAEPAPVQPTPVDQRAEAPGKPQPDIRRLIGINDKYQFISELFGNDVKAYETSISYLSAVPNRKAAEHWIQENLLLTPQAEESDGLQNFRLVLDRFFSAAP